MVASASVIYQLDGLCLINPDDPHVTRHDGGHLIIMPEHRVRDRTQLSPEAAVKLIRFTMMSGQAMTEALSMRGIPIGRINYQDNGNWSVFQPEGPYLHVHLYGRATNAHTQRYGEALHLPKPDTGFYQNVERLTTEDERLIAEKLEMIRNLPKYSSPWCG